MTPPVVLTIAGSDSGGGAGLQADLKTFGALGVHGTSAVSILTAQNTMRVAATHQPPASFLASQLSAITDDFVVAATKTGFLATADNVAVVVAMVDRLGQLVVDPVMVSSRGDRLVSEATQRAYVEQLFPRAAVITPNAVEAGLLLGRTLTSVADLEEAARDLHRFGSAVVVVKGGGLMGEESVDAVYDGTTMRLLRTERVATVNTHGTGCSFSAATAAYLARGYAPRDALDTAKRFVTAGLVAGADWRLGGGHGPIDHFYAYRLYMEQSGNEPSPD